MRPGQRDAVVGAGAAADLVEDHQAARRRVVEDVRRLGHLHHERALAAAQLVAGADAREDAVGQADRRLLAPARSCPSGPSASAAPTWRMNVTFAGHVRPGDEPEQCRRPAPSVDVVGHERPRRQRLVEDRMPAVARSPAPARRPAPAGSTAATRPARPAPPARRASASTSAGLQQPGRLRRRPARAGRRNSSYSRCWIFSSAVEDLLLVLLQLRRDVALGVLERLLALVVGRDLGGVGVRDLDVVAEDLVEADLEAGDAGAGDLLGLEAGDPLLAAAWRSRAARPARRRSRGG